MATRYNQLYQPIFSYGEVGESLEGLRDSQIAQNSAKEIYNFYVTEMGTLRVAKTYTDMKIHNVDQKIIGRRNTKYNFFLLFFKDRIVSVSKDNVVPISVIAVSNMHETSNISIFNNFIFIRNTSNSIGVYYFSDAGILGSTNFLNTVKLPFQNKIEMGMDVYRIFKQADNTLRPELLGTYPENLTLAFGGAGEIILGNTGVHMVRVYLQYKSLVGANQIGGAYEGMVFGVFRNYQSPNGTLQHHLGNLPVTFGGVAYDATYGSNYFTIGTPYNSGYGKLIFGTLENFLADYSKIVDMVEFQSRLCIATEDKLYFSKILEYNNFVPELDESGGFFIKPATIDGNQTKIIKLSVGNGLYTVCNEGVIVIGWGTSVSSTNLSNVKIAGNSPPSTIGVVIEDIYYYLGADGILRAILPDFSGGVIKFANVLVESYDYSMKILTISKGVMNEDNVLLVTPQEGEFIWVYTYLKNDRLFRRVKIASPQPANLGQCGVFGFGDNLLVGDRYRVQTQLNFPQAHVILNLPFIQTPSRGAYLNDFLMQYGRMVINVYANKPAVKRISVNNYAIQKLSTQAGNYNVWDFLGKSPLVDLTITIDTNQTKDTIEIRGINGFFG